MMKFRLGFLLLLFLLVLFPVSALASTWAKTYGGTSRDYAYSIQQTSDGGFIVAGATLSYGAGSDDIWVLKLDAAGNVIWQKTYGGSNEDYAYSIQQTSDGGFIVAGYTDSFGAGNRDYCVLKLDAAGNVIWQKTYGGSEWDYAHSIQQTSDGGFIVAGETTSFGVGSADIWVLKLDAAGNVIWQKTYGGSNEDYAYSIQQTSDGGFIVAGYTRSYGAGSDDIWVLKLDAAGNVIWQKTYGGSGGESAYSIQQTSDGGFIVSGENYYNHGAIYDALILKLDASGNIIWQKTYGNATSQRAGSIQQTLDGGFIVGGWTSSGDFDTWLSKLDATGNLTWQKIYGAIDTAELNWDGNRYIHQTSDGGFILAGYTKYLSAGHFDIWVLKVNSNGNIPGCDLIQNTSVVPANINYIPGISDSIPADTSATVTNTAVVPINTAATVNEQCFNDESSTDLSYAPVTPCRIVDTRLAGGAIPPNGIRSYNVWGDVASQGGNPAGCPSPKGEPFTAHINVTVVPSGNGNIVAYPFGSTAPNASLVNYRADAQNVANSGTVKTCFNCSQDIFIKSNAGTAHVIIDVLGYDFEKP
jgi:uncharacterized delta-60 repeat protein